jgi:hypothetical protein
MYLLFSPEVHAISDQWHFIFNILFNLNILYYLNSIEYL